MQQKLKISYDKEADVLYVSLGHPEYTKYVEVGEDLILRLDPETEEVVGFTIIGFAAHFSPQSPLPLEIPLSASFALTRQVEELASSAELKVK